MKIFKRKEEEIILELSNGESKKFIIKEQLRSVVDRIFEIQINLAMQEIERQKQITEILVNNNDVINETINEKDFDNMTEKEQEEYKIKNSLAVSEVLINPTEDFIETVLKHETEMFKLMTDSEDLEWMAHAYASQLLAIVTTFEEVNPYFIQKKTPLENLGKALNI
jgi:uncharacterized protein YlzI (FlbEa/FlbD family)